MNFFSNTNMHMQWKCGVGIHPALNVELLYHQGKSEEMLATAMTLQGNKPYLALPARNDSEKIKPGGSVIEILARARDVTPEEVSILFEKAQHGFCSRGDPENDLEVNEAQMVAEAKTAEYITKCAHVIKS